jgi:Saxitoxin biosynthesis operon protein SxtJ
MAVIEINKNPSQKELAWFGLMFLVFFGLIGGVVWWRFEAQTAAYTLWGVAAAIVAVYYALPPVRLPIYLGWLYAAFPIGWVISHVVMGAIYYLVITPFALVFKLIGRDALDRKLDKNAKSYWVEHRTGGDPQRYFKQF